MYKVFFQSIKNFINRIFKSITYSNGNNILIFLERPGLGDAVLHFNALYNLSIMLKDSGDYNIYLACDTKTSRFLKILKSTFSMNLIELEFGKLDRYNPAIFQRNYRKLNIRSWKRIISLDRIGSYTKALIVGLTYDKVIYPEYQDGQVKIADKVYDFCVHKLIKIGIEYRHSLYNHKKMVYVVLDDLIVGLINREYRKYNIPVLQNITAYNKFCVVSMGISNEHDNCYRSWEICKFVYVINFILENTNLDIYILGNEADKERHNALYRKCEVSNRIKDLTGKTSFKEWVELLRNAEFVFGNDSGYIHLASALETTAFVISGYWNYGRFLPYEKDTVDTICPIDIRAEQPKCIFCNTREISQSVKKDCDVLIRDQKVYKCINDISVDMAVSALESFFNKNNIRGDIHGV